MAAIYMWFDNEQMVLTTTLYPVEVIDYLRLSADISGGDMRNITEESHFNSIDMLGITKPQILIAYGPNEEDYFNSMDLIGITRPQILIDYGPNEEDYFNSADVLGITLLDLLVTADTPDEMLRLGADVNPSACSMTDV